MYVFPACVLCSIVLAVIRYSRGRTTFHLPPGPIGMPYFGIAFTKNFSRCPHKIMTSWAETFGPIYSFTAMGSHVVVISDAALAKEAMTGECFKTVFDDKFPLFVEDMMNVGLARYRDVKPIRDAMVKGLHVFGDRVHRFESCFMEELKRFVEELLATGGEEVEVRPVLPGDNCLHVHDVTDPSVDIILQKMPFLRILPGKVRRACTRAFVQYKQTANALYTEPKLLHRDGEQRGLVDALLHIQKEQRASHCNGQSLNVHQIQAVALMSIIGGSEGMSNVLQWTLLTLLNHPDCLARVQNEVDTVIGRERFPCVSDKPNMPYTMAACLETLRYVTAAILMAPRRCIKDVTFHGYDIPEGASVIVNTWHIHHDHRKWADPWTFRPERFLDQQGQLVGPDHRARQSFLGFGIGKRACSGASLGKSRLLIYIATLVQRLNMETTATLTSADSRNITPSPVLYCPPFSCKFIPRD